MLHRLMIAALALAATLDVHPRNARASAVQAGPPSGAVFACYRRAHEATSLDEAGAADLCDGAADASPVACFLEARRRTFLSPDDSIYLCRCATSTAPVDCYREGHQTTLLDGSRILPLCSPRERLHLRPDCSAEITNGNDRDL